MLKKCVIFVCIKLKINMITLDENKTDYTIEEYLELDRVSEVRLEYSRGKVQAMSGGTFNHSLIGSNTNRAIGNGISGGECMSLNNDLKVFIDHTKQFRYPDGMVICGEVEFAQDDTAIKNPTLIIEVLSKSTEHLDRGQKFHEYCTLPSFKEYVLIAQDRPVVDTLFREEKGSWKMITTIGLERSFKLFSLGIEIAMKDLYENARNLNDPNFRLDFN